MATITVDLFKDTPAELRFVASIVDQVSRLREQQAQIDAGTGSVQRVDDTKPEAPTPPASETPTPPAPQESIGGPTHDTAGVPYDPRTHAVSRTFDKHGRWKYARGLDADVRAAAEKRDAQLAGTNSAAPPPPPAPAADVPAPPPPPPGFQTAVAGGAPPPPPVSVPAGAADTGNAGSVPNGAPTFREVMKLVGDALRDKTLSHEDLGSALATVGLEANQLPSLVAMPDKIADFQSYVLALIKAK